MFTIQNLKWLSTGFVFTGIFLTSLNIYPLNILFHATGAVGWTVAGVMVRDRAIMTNFGLQLPLFGVGFLKLAGLV